MFLQLYSVKELCWIIEKIKSIIWTKYFQFKNVKG